MEVINPYSVKKTFADNKVPVKRGQLTQEVSSSESTLYLQFQGQKYNPDTHEPFKTPRRTDQVDVTANGFTFYADPEMVPLLEALNRAGVQTYSHCSGHLFHDERTGEVLGHGPAWVVLELDNLNIETRQKDGRTQLLLTVPRPAWSPSNDKATGT